MQLQSKSQQIGTNRNPGSGSGSATRPLVRGVDRRCNDGPRVVDTVAVLNFGDVRVIQSVVARAIDL